MPRRRTDPLVARTLLLCFDLAPFGDVAIVFLQRFRKGVPAGAIGHEEHEIRIVRRNGSLKAGKPRIGNRRGRKTVNQVSIPRRCAAQLAAAQPAP